MAWLTSDLLTKVRLYGRLRDTDVDYTDANLLAIADDLITSKFSEVMAGARQGHWLASEDSTITAAQSDYRLPKRALADCIVDVNVVDAQGVARPLAGPLPQSEIGTYTIATSGTPHAFAVVGNVVRLLPTPSVTQDTLRIRYLIRRSKLVTVASAGLITAINTGTRVVTCSSVPASWTTSSRFDFVQAEPGFEHLGTDRTISAVVTGASGTLTFSATLPTDLAVGDYVALRWQTPVVQLPDEMHGALANLVASHVLIQTGDRSGAEMLDGNGGTQLDSGQRMVSPRVSSRPEVIRHQPLVRRSRWWP